MLKIDKLRLLAPKTNAAVIGISETKLADTVLEGEVSIDGYDIIRSDRNGHGGGVACYTRKDLVCNPRKHFSPDIGNIFFDIQLPISKPILVGILYRLPTSTGFLDKLTLAIFNANNFDNQEVYILGDVNIHLNNKNDISYRNKRCRKFCSLQ